MVTPDQALGHRRIQVENNPSQDTTQDQPEETTSVNNNMTNVKDNTHQENTNKTMDKLTLASDQVGHTKSEQNHHTTTPGALNLQKPDILCYFRTW